MLSLGKRCQAGSRPSPSASTASRPTTCCAGAAVAQHPLAAGVGRDQAADGRRVAGGEVDAEVQPQGPDRPLQCGKGHPGADGDLAGDLVDRPDVAQPATSTARPRPSGRHAAADEPGVAALGHDRLRRTGRRSPARRRPRRSTPGRTTQRARPVNRRVQSVSYDAVTPGSVSTCCSPRTARRSSSRGARRSGQDAEAHRLGQVARAPGRRPARSRRRRRSARSPAGRG